MRASEGTESEKQRGEPFGSPPCRNSHAGTLLGYRYNKRRTISPAASSSLHFNHLRQMTDSNAPKSVIDFELGATKVVRDGRRMMKRIGRALAVVVLCAVGLSCSRKHHTDHPAERQTAEPAPPTPDTTPVPALRTPAGLVLGIEGTPAPAPPTPLQTVPPPPAPTRAPSS